MNISTQASSFYKAALRCGEMRPTEDNKYEKLMIPQNVCLAFSIELNLKFLIEKEGHKASNSHDLKKLFTQLNGKTQNSIITEFGDAKKDFIDKLEKVSKTFEFWRYVHEHLDQNFSLNLDFLYKLAKLLEDKK